MQGVCFNRVGEVETLETAVAAIKNATDGRGADSVMELVGNPVAQRLAYEVMRPGGTMSVATALLILPSARLAISTRIRLTEPADVLLGITWTN